MSPEEYQRIKEAEKEHLRKLKQLKEAVRTFERQKSVNQALEQMSSANRDALDTQAEMVEKLALDTAQHEARLDMALEARADEETAAERAEAAERLEEEARQARARDLIRQMKAELGMGSGTRERTTGGDPSRAPAAPERAEETPAAGRPENPTGAPAPRPEKTIGRM